MEQRPVTYHIIGSGVAGLSCAKIVKEKIPSAKTIIYEAGEHPGGRCYSYEDKDLGCRLDNATHVVIGANKHLARFINPAEWEPECRFWDAHSETFSTNYRNFPDLIIKSMTNTPADKTAPEIRKTILWKTFPWGKKQRKIYFSKNDLSQRIINLFTSYADELLLNNKLLKIDSQFGRAAQLTFSGKQVEIGADDKVILAVDNRSFCRLTGETPLEHNAIVNIFYRTSQKIYLPDNINFIGISRGLADWIFVNDNILGATLSAVPENPGDLQQLARDVWKEIGRLRGVNSAFVPSFKIFYHKTATISQDRATNDKRPLSAGTQYPNVFLAGDWTMKDHPCCLETAVLSAERAVKESLKA